MIGKHQELIEAIKKDCLSQITEAELIEMQGNFLLFERKITPLFKNALRKRHDVSLSNDERQLILSSVISDILGLGPIENLLREPEVSEVMVNGPGQVYIEKNGRLELSGVTFQDETHLQYFVEKILSPLGRRLTESEPCVDARLDDGSRVNLIAYPVSLGGTILTIRKFSRRILRIEDLIEQKSITRGAADFLCACVEAKVNIIVSGGSGAGKTTLLNILSNYILENERVIAIEDAAELQLKGKHILRLEARPANIEGKGEVTIRRLLRNALHMRPDRIIVGEVRSVEVLDMLQAMTTGHEGSMTTLHANSSSEALDRLEMLTLMDNSNISAAVARRQIISAVDLIVHMARFPDGSRRVVQISELLKDAKTEFKLYDIFYREETDLSDLKLSGDIPSICNRLKQKTGFSF